MEKEGRLLYFYCDFREKDSQKAETVLGTLICQICAQFPGLPAQMRDFVGTFSTDSGQYISPSYDDLEEVFLALLKELPSVTIVLDALDECINRDNLLLLLQQLPTSASCHVRILVSSRQEGDIEEAFEGYAQHSLRVHAVDEDIDSYVFSAISKSKRLQRLPRELQHQVRTTLHDRARGM